MGDTWHRLYNPPKTVNPSAPPSSDGATPPVPPSPVAPAVATPDVAPSDHAVPQRTRLAGALAAWPHVNNIWVLGAVALTAISVTSLVLVWSNQQRIKTLEQELVRRQQSSHDQATEARLLAIQARDAAADAAAKLGLVEMRVAESSLQRSQVEELIQSMARSRDENVLADVEAALRVAQQQSAITGSPDPVVAVLRQSEERLARYNQPRLERVRRAVARDLDRARAVTSADLPTLSIRLDEVVRMVDDLPLVNTPERRPAAAVASAASAAASAASATAGGWLQPARDLWQGLGTQVWEQVRSLIRVSRIDQPEAALLAPEQSYFLRENLKLRLLNARLALLSRQFDQVQTDLQQAQHALDHYFDRHSRRVIAAADLVRVVASQSRQVVIPRPDDTLAALATATAGR